MRIALTFPFMLTNDGDYTLLKAVLRAISDAMPDAEFELFLWKPYDLSGLRDFAIRVHDAEPPRMPISLIKLIILYLLAFIYRLLRAVPPNEQLRTIANSDVALVITRDVLVMNGLGGLRSFLYTLFRVFLPKLMGKPTVFFASDVRLGSGVKRWLVAPFVRLVFSKLDMTIVRDENSRINLLRVGVPNSKIIVGADTALLLKPTSREEAMRIFKAEGIQLHERPIVGLSINPLVYRARGPSGGGWHEVAAILAETVDFLAEELGAITVFIPRVAIFGENDIALAHEIRALVKHKECFLMLSRQYMPEQVRSIIGLTDLFIAITFHALVHAISMSVPTVAIDYGGKAIELMRELGLAGMVIPAKELNPDVLKAKIVEAWIIKDELRASLPRKIPELRDKAMRGVEALLKFLRLLK